MYQPQHFLFSLLAIFSTSNAWLYSTTNVDLSSPPPIIVGDEVVDGPKLPNYNTSPWPCSDYPVPQDVTRTPFPVFEGRLSFSLTNNSVGSLPNYQYEGDAYFGQVSLGDGTYTGASNEGDGGYSGYGYIDTYTWSDFPTSQACSWEVEVVRVISEALGKDVKELTVADVVGLNATVGMRIVLFGPNPLVTDQGTANNPIEQMYQCGYVTFTDNDLSHDPSAGYCNGGGSSTSDVGASPSTLLTAAFPSATGPHASSPPTIYPSPGRSSDGAGSGSQTRGVAVGTGIGVSMGVSLLILIIAFICLRRRKSRKHTQTISADIIVTGPQDIELTNGRRGEKGFQNWNVESSASSVHSEPLPPYMTRENR